MASTGAIRRYLSQHPAEFDPRKYLSVAMQAMQEICYDRFEAFGCAGHASKINPISLELMSQKYDKLYA